MPEFERAITADGEHHARFRDDSSSTYKSSTGAQTFSGAQRSIFCRLEDCTLITFVKYRSAQEAIEHVTFARVCATVSAARDRVHFHPLRLVNYGDLRLIAAGSEPG